MPHLARQESLSPKQYLVGRLRKPRTQEEIATKARFRSQPAGSGRDSSNAPRMLRTSSHRGPCGSRGSNTLRRAICRPWRQLAPGRPSSSPQRSKLYAPAPGEAPSTFLHRDVTQFCSFRGNYLQVLATAADPIDHEAGNRREDYVRKAIPEGWRSGCIYRLP